MHFPSRLVALAALLVTTISWGPAAPSVAAEEKPNVIVINLDDADYSLIDDPALDAYFPNIATHLRDEGLRLSNLHVSTPLCGPSRASLLRSQYAHNTGVLTNSPTAQWTGGFGPSYDNGYTSDELGRWMQDAGYTTMLVGKYLHEGFPHLSGDNRYRPPGWDEFYATRGGKYYNFTQLVNGELVGPTADYPNQFRTDVERTEAVALLRDHAPADEPMFLYLAPYAPHESTTTPIYAARHASAFPDARVPRTPDFNEADMSDKPDQLQQLPPYAGASLDNLDDLYRRRLRSMASVDQMVGALVDELAALGELDDTYIMLTSDNGFSLGHNRLAAKALPFDRMTRVGMLVRGPDVPAGAESDALLSHVDLAPTIVDLARGHVPGWVDGRSFAPILSDPGGASPMADRSWIPIENWGPKNHRGLVLDGQYRALRGAHAIYVEWANGDREYYDLVADPYQLDNRYRALSPAEKYELALAVHDVYGGSAAGNQPPDVTVVKPVDGATLYSPTTVRGRASDDTGVARVELIVRDRAHTRYWNGESFQDEFVAVDAVLSSPGASQTRFRKRLRLPNVRLDIFARAYDVDGTSDPVVEVVRQEKSTDGKPPITRLNKPVAGQTISGRLRVDGGATDNKGVDRVMLVIKDRGTNHYWDGTTFQPAFTRVPAELVRPGQRRTHFRYRADLPSGRYMISARAYDINGNFTNPPPLATVTVE